jgi:hypothetical protein
MVELFLSRIAATRRQYLLYAALYFVCGLAMHFTGKALVIAEFVNWWQVIPCYVLYLAPASLLVRHREVFEQYLFGLFVLAPLELIGYALGSSIAHDGNLLDELLGPRNFTLAMTVFFAGIPPAGNAAVARLEALLDRRKA